ncbi:hypothetical protein PL321_09375 [Caloramator sp. mosi_1]|uniref:hypothetical protein n=1 Tax=Caloramator sp. mosi_1 TaxID=3023090 RepID=UPI00235EAA78|nr:hypothetical protein [Caloramator sp. mosi_1]WDC85483.1 hypothetical protein PL321_09375 [Caloramator sp. mosi_1]
MPIFKGEPVERQTSGKLSGQINTEAELDDEEAAAILAVVAHELKRPLNEIKIKSIRLLNK